jgi:hypothetical protein
MSNFRKFVTSNYSYNELADIANYGCQGGVHGLIYYKELRDLYGEYASDIHDIVGEWRESGGEGVPEFIAEHLGCFDMFVSHMVWFAVEWVAFEETDGQYEVEEEMVSDESRSYGPHYRGAQA